MAFQFAFAGDGVQDAGAFLAAFEHHAVSIGKMTDLEKLPLLVATFYGRARDWYESLTTNQQVNYQLLVQQFKAKYIRRRDATEVREALFRLRMSSTMEYNDYEREFIDLWATWIRLRGGTEDEWFKMDRFKAGLSPHFALETNLRDPTTFQALVQTCQAYNRKIQVLQATVDSTVATFKSPILQQSPIVYGDQVFPNVFSTYQPNIPVMQEVTQPKVEGGFLEQANQRLDEIARQIQNMQAHFNVSQTRNAPRQRKVIVCYTCGVEGHISTQCPSRQQGDWGKGTYQFQGIQNNTSNKFHQLNNHVGGESTLAQIPTSPHKVNLLDCVYDIVEDCDKTTSASHENKELEGDSSNSQQKRKSKENNLEDEPRKKHPQRKIKIDDMPMGKDVELFDLKQKLIFSGPRITWPQLRQLYPTLKREWGGVSSIQSIKELHCAKIVQVKNRKDIRPTISVTINGLLIMDALVDSDIRIDPTSNVIVSKIGNPIYPESSTKIDIVDGHLASCSRFMEDVVIEYFGMSISMDLHVILKGTSCSLVLVRPCMQELHVIQDWTMINLSSWKGFNIFYDMYQQRVIKGIKGKETSNDYGKQEEASITSDGSSWDMEKKLCHMVSKDEGEVIEEGIVTIKGKKKVIPNDMHGEEDIRGENIKNHIKLKESIQIAQRLRQLEIVQKVRSLERFIHMLTCLLLSRTMYRMALLVFRELIRT